MQPGCSRGASGRVEPHIWSLRDDELTLALALALTLTLALALALAPALTLTCEMTSAPTERSCAARKLSNGWLRSSLAEEGLGLGLGLGLGCMGVWVCGCMGVWVCGCMGVWVCGCMG